MRRGREQPRWRRVFSSVAAIASFAVGTAGCESEKQPAPERPESVVVDGVEVFPESGHGGDTDFTGIVSRTPMSAEYRTPIKVDAYQVQLDMVHPVVTCASPESQALPALRRIVEKGDLVRVRKDRDPLDRLALLYRVVDGEPQDVTIQELLVLSGWWEPDGLIFGTPDYNNSRGIGALAPYELRATYNLKPFQEEVARRLVEVANVAQRRGLGAHGPCLANARVDAAAYRAYQERVRREAEEDDRRYQLMLRYCRDGDGDGVCFES